MAVAASRVGILTENSVLSERDGTSVVTVQLDAHAHRFLSDHMVASRPLLSTVMGVEAIGCAVALAHPGAELGQISDIEVGPPYLLAEHGRGQVEVVLYAERSGTRAEVWSRPPDAAPVLHYRAAISAEPSTSPAPAVRPAEDGPSVGADAIYQLFFHGKSFRVLESARLESSGMTGVLARDRPSIIEPARPSITAPLLIELCLQTAGLWELATLDAMRIPTGIDRVTRLTDLDAEPAPAAETAIAADTAPAAETVTALRAVVTPRPDGHGGHLFDAVVVDDLGQAHLTVEGYRSTEFGHPHDRVAAQRIRAALGRD